MLRITLSAEASHAKSYYTSQLKFEEKARKLSKYYGKEQEFIGTWQGHGAQLLSLEGKVDQKRFERLCDNLHPESGRRLTARTNDNRRVGYDFNFHCPKSVSVVHALTKDERLVVAFRDAVAETMRHMESVMETRVRVGQADTDRHTGNMVWAEFVHFTARPVNGIPDPHLHAHCLACNVTYDQVEQKWKAGQFGNIKRDAEYYEAAFHSRLALKVKELGYGIRRTGRWWEIEGVDRSLIENFSRRTELIEETAISKGVSSVAGKSQLGALTRERKVMKSIEVLRSEWETRLTSADQQSLQSLRKFQSSSSTTSEACVDYAINHSFERASVVSEKGLATEALRHGFGEVDLVGVHGQLKSKSLLRDTASGQEWCTTQDVLDEEVANIEFVRTGLGKSSVISSQQRYAFRNEALGEDQKAAVRHLLSSKDRVTAIRGPAGTGKTTMMKEAVEAIEVAGYKVFTFAPSAEASRSVLRQEGFDTAQTVAHLLANRNLHGQLRGQVVWIDEAGLLSVRQMRAVFRLAEEQDFRIVLSGDTAQHSSVERGDALRILEKYAGLVPAELTNIRRQRHEQYRAAVRDFSQGNASEGYQKLEQMGAVVELPQEERYQALAKEYATLVSKGKTALVVSPTHAEGSQVTAHIRAELKRREKLSTDERKFLRLVNVQWTEAQRRHLQNYRPGLIVQFHSATPGFSPGQRLKVVETGPYKLLRLKDDRGLHKLPLEFSSRFQVYEPDSVALAPGDEVRITQNGATADGVHRLNNGAVYKIKRFTPEGDIQLANGWIVGKDYGNLAHGYCQTSHSSQSKTVDHVLIAQSASLGASSVEQFYVSVSRGRDAVTVYTDNKAWLAKAVQSSGARLSAKELVSCPQIESPLSPLEKLLEKEGIRPAAAPPTQAIEEQLSEENHARQASSESPSKKLTHRKSTVRASV